MMENQASAEQHAFQNYISDDKLKALVLQQLVLLVHANNCRRKGNEECSLEHCRTIKDVLNHMKSCQIGETCEFPHCSSSGLILDHWNNCVNQDCSICLSLKRTDMQSAENKYLNIPFASNSLSQAQQQSNEIEHLAEPGTSQQIIPSASTEPISESAKNALQQLMQTLKNPTPGPDHPQQVLQILKANPQLMAAFIKQRQRQNQSNQGQQGPQNFVQQQNQQQYQEIINQGDETNVQETVETLPHESASE